MLSVRKDRTFARKMPLQKRHLPRMRKKWTPTIAVCRSSKKTESKKTERQQRRAGPKYRQGRKVVNALEDEGELEIAALDTEKTPKDAIWVSPRINGTKVTMELDTGSAVSVIPVSTFKKQFPKTKLQPTPVHLRTYCGNRLRTLGKTTVAIELNGQKAQDDVYIVDSTGPPLFGRTWLRKLQLDWKEIHSVTASPKERLDKLKERYTEIFKTDLGCLQGVYGSLSLCKDATPNFVKARPVPYALRPKIESELERMEAEGIVTPIQWSEWATPIVPVVKPNGTVRICGDFKVTVNPQLKVDQYPLPLIDDIFASLAGGKKFSKIDLRSAYTQMKMTDNSKPMLTLNTHRGLFRLNRLAFGIASAPAIWQRAIDQVLSGLTKTRCILDDIIVTGEDDEEHFQNLEAVLKRLQTAGLRVNSKKCRFFADRIEYCGHEVSKDGLRKLKTKIQAIVDAPRPENVSQLRSFLGLLNYYQRILPDLATTLHPLNNLLHKGTKFDWCTDCQAAFKKVKNLIASNQVLTHYDPRLPVRLASDASPYGIGAVLSHVYPTGEERPIAFASRTLTQAEKGYSQIDKEALAIIWAVKRFNIYLYGRQFELVTDHQPLISIFNPEKGIPTMTAARLQRYALFLAGHDYTIMYKQTKEHANADSMSRLPLPCTEPPTAAVQDVDIFHASQVHALPVTAQKVKKETRNDPLLAQGIQLYSSRMATALHGWPAQTFRHSQGWTYPAWRMHSLGKPSDHSKEFTSNSTSRASWRTSWNGENEGTRPKLLLVAPTGHRHRNDRTFMQRMPAKPEESCNCTSSSMGMASTTMAAIARRLRRTYWQLHVPHRGRRAQQKAGSYSNAFNHGNTNDLEIATNIRPARYSGTDRQRQRTTVWFRGICGFRQSKWNSPHPKRTLSSSYERTRWTVRPNFQERIEG